MSSETINIFVIYNFLSWDFNLADYKDPMNTPLITSQHNDPVDIIFMEEIYNFYF